MEVLHRFNIHEDQDIEELPMPSHPFVRKGEGGLQAKNSRGITDPVLGEAPSPRV